MTVKELIEELQKMPQNAYVVYDGLGVWIDVKEVTEIDSDVVELA